MRSHCYDARTLLGAVPEHLTPTSGENEDNILISTRTLLFEGQPYLSRLFAELHSGYSKGGD